MIYKQAYEKVNTHHNLVCKQIAVLRANIHLNIHSDVKSLFFPHVNILAKILFIKVYKKPNVANIPDELLNVLLN